MIVEARKRSVVALVLVLLSMGPLVATDLVIGTWVAQPDPEHPRSGPPLTMTIEASGKSGRKITPCCRSQRRRRRVYDRLSDGRH
jgi:hypothetical protein